MMNFNVFGITENTLASLSYESKLGKSLKNTLRKFDRSDVINEILDLISFYEENSILKNPIFTYRIKSLQSCIMKYEKYYPSTEVQKCFNDILGIRIVLDNYSEIFKYNLNRFRVADMSDGKSNDDGYRGIHLYFQLSNKHYPIEIQINTYKDRQFNDWLHLYLYKYKKDNNIGILLREKYDKGFIKSKIDFQEELRSVLFNSKKI